MNEDEIFKDLVEEMQRRALGEGFISDDPVVELLERASTLIDEAVVDIMARARLGRMAG